MKRKNYWILIVVFVVLFLETSGYLLIQIYSKDTDYIANRNYDKIRKMLQGDSSISKYWQVANLNYIPNPNYHKDLLSHNRLGYRGEPVKIHHQNKLRILCIGGSTTYGTGVNDNSKTYPSQLRKILKDSFDLNAEVINAGLEAATSFEELSLYLFKFRYFQPDIVILHSGGNDALAKASNPNSQLDFTDYRKMNFYLPPWRNGRFLLKSNFLSFLIIHFGYNNNFSSNKNLYSYNNGELKFVTKWSDEISEKERNENLDYNNFYQNYKTLSESIIRDSSKLIHLTFTYNQDFDLNSKTNYIENIIRNNELIHQVALQTNSPALDLDSTLIPLKYYIDDCHLNENGEKQKAYYVAQEIITLLKDE